MSNDEIIPSPKDTRADGSLTSNVYYDAFEAISSLSVSLSQSEQEMARYANMLASSLDDIYEKANQVLDADADNVADQTKDDKQQDAQNIYSNDSTEYQNLETEFNSMVDAANTSVNNLANAQTQLSQIGDTLNGDAQYMSNLLASPLSA